MSDAWEEIQAIKNKRNSLRERLEKRKKERQDILSSNLTALSPASPYDGPPQQNQRDVEQDSTDLVKTDPELELELLKSLCEVTLQIPITSTELVASLKVTLQRHASHSAICNLLHKFATQKLITVREIVKDGRTIVEVHNLEHSKLCAMITEDVKSNSENNERVKRKRDDSLDRDDDEKKKKDKKDPKATDILVRLSVLKNETKFKSLVCISVAFSHAVDERKRK